MQKPCYVLNCNESTEASQEKYPNICKLHIDQRQKVLNILQKSLNSVNTFNEIFENHINQFLNIVFECIKKTSKAIDDVKTIINQNIKALFIGKKSKNSQNFFENILDVSTQSFENKLKRLEEFKEDQYFYIFENLKNYAKGFKGITTVFDLYDQDINQIMNFFSSFKIESESSSNYISFVIEKTYRNYLIRICKTDTKITEFNLNFEEKVRHPAVCDLPGSKVLICGGKYAKFHYSSDCFLFDSSKNSLIRVASTEGLNILSGCIYYQEFCYFFGGRRNSNSIKTAKKFSLQTNFWNSISELPCETSTHNPTLFNGVIWMSGYMYEHIFYYEPSEDCYYRFMLEELYDRKSLLKFKDKLYLLSNTNAYLIVGNNLKFVCKTFAISVIKSIETEDSVIFHDGNWIYQFTPYNPAISVLEKVSFNPAKPCK